MPSNLSVTGNYTRSLLSEPASRGRIRHDNAHPGSQSLANNLLSVSSSAEVLTAPLGGHHTVRLNSLAKVKDWLISNFSPVGPSDYSANDAEENQEVLRKGAVLRQLLSEPSKGYDQRIKTVSTVGTTMLILGLGAWALSYFRANTVGMTQICVDESRFPRDFQQEGSLLYQHHQSTEAAAAQQLSTVTDSQNLHLSANALVTKHPLYNKKTSIASNEKKDAETSLIIGVTAPKNKQKAVLNCIYG